MAWRRRLGADGDPGDGQRVAFMFAEQPLSTGS